MKSIGFVVNPHKEDALRLAAELVLWLGERGVAALVEHEPARGIGREDIGATLEAVSETDMVVVLGGDGSILRAARVAGPKGTPILGVHFGQYGFITEIHPPDVIPALTKVLEGDFKISERMMFTAKLIRGDEELLTAPAMNDVVVSKGPLSRLLTLHTFINDRFITTYAADGIIIATPTGSTGYSLSAGGPVVHPSVQIAIVTPICPHTLNARSLVVPDTEAIQIVGECTGIEDDMTLTVDGQAGYKMLCSDKVDVRRADYSARIVYWDKLSFYDKLRSRLRWGERFS